MSKGILRSDPPRADHRFIKYVLSSAFSKDHIRPDPKEFDKVSNVFGLVGGSWERLFKGSTRDIELLKKCIKIAIKKGVMSKMPSWR